jgi:hypothetical protein
MGVIVSKGWVATNPQLVGYNGTVSYFPAKKIAVVVFSTLGRRSQLPVSYSTDALLRIARILTPNSVPELKARPRRLRVAAAYRGSSKVTAVRRAPAMGFRPSS